MPFCARRLSILPLIAFLMALLPDRAGAQIANPDFESDGGGFGVAAAWASFGGSKWEGVYDGARAWTQGVSDIAANGGICGIRQSISVTSGARYRLSMFARVNNSDLDAAVGVSPSGATDPTAADYGTLTTSTSWTEVNVEFTALAPTVTVFLRGRNPKSWQLPGTWVYFDGVTIEQTTTPGNVPPTAVASGTPLSGEAPLTVSFDAAGSSDPDPGDTLTYAWDFGDGSGGQGISPSHEYASAGAYTVILTVDDGNGGTDTDELTVNVTEEDEFPPGTGPNLVVNPGFEMTFSNGLAQNWHAFTTSGSGYVRRSSRLGRIGSGIYTGTNGFSQTVRLNPKTILLSDLALGHAQGLRTALPDAIIIGRLFIDTLAGQYLNDPEYYGRIHADNCYAQHVDKGSVFDAWQGFNEPFMNEVENVRKVARFEKAFAERCHELGLKACVFNIAVGNPAPVENILVQEVVDCLAIADYVGYHAYGGVNDQLMVGPEAPWFALRWRMVKDLYDQHGYRMPPVIYTECTTFYAWKQGYADPWFTPVQIRDDLIAFEGMTKQADPWSVGMCIYLVGSHSAQWDGWEVANEPAIYEDCGDYNLDNPADAWEGLYSQQFGETTGGYAGGVCQAVTATAGKQYRLDHWMKYETYGVSTDVAYRVGYDLTGQTSNASAGSIVWSGDLIAGETRETDWWYDHTVLLTAGGSQVSIWFKASQPAGHDAFRAMIDEVSLRETAATQDPVIGRSSSSLSPETDAGSDAPDDSFTIWNAGGGTLTYTITTDETWLSTSPQTGTSSGEVDTITVSYTTASLAAGTHTAAITLGDPNATPTTATIQVTLTVNPVTVPADFDHDGDVDQEDFAELQRCYTGEGVAPADPTCLGAKLDHDVDVDADDFAVFQRCLSGANLDADPSCVSSS